MYPIWKLCAARLGRKKVQSGIITLILLLSTLLLSTAAVVLVNTNNIYMSIHEELNGSHEILELKTGIHDPQLVQQWWKAQDGVMVSEIMKYRHLAGINLKGKDIPNIEMDMVSTPSNPIEVDKLLFLKGNAQAVPNPGSVWIPTSLAYSKGISVGDEIEFENDNGIFKLAVSGVVIDLPYCAPFSANARIWMNESDYKQYIQSESGNDMYMMSLRYDDYSRNMAYWEKFEQYLGSPYLETLQNFESLSSFYSVINTIIGFIMVFLALVMMLIAIFTIGFTISDDILSNYKTFGIIKSLGMTTRQTICINVVQYGFLATLAVIPGIVLSYFLSGFIINSTLSYLKTKNSAVSFQFLNAAIFIVLLIMLLILASAFLFSYRIKKIEPVQAIRYGTSERNISKAVRSVNTSDKGLLSFHYLPISLVIGLRSIVKNIRGTVFVLLVSALMASVLVFGFTFIYSILSIQQNIAEWGYDSSDITVRVDNNSLKNVPGEDFISALSNDQSIENYNLYSDLNGVVSSGKDHVIGGEASDSMSILFSVVDGSYDDIGFTNLKGRNPRNEGEISIGVNVAGKYGKEVGDTIDAYIKGQKITFTITGIYQAIANMSYSGRIYADAVRNADPDYKVKDVVFINLQSGVSPSEYAKRINEQFTSISAFPQEELISEVFSQAVAMLVIPMLVICVAFAVIAFVIVLCICHINNKKQSTTFGIFKSIGMSSGKIRLSILSGFLVLEAAGTIIGAFVGIRLLPVLINAVLSNYGILEMPLVVNSWGILAIIIFAYAIASLGAWFASGTIRRTSPRILIVE